MDHWIIFWMYQPVHGRQPWMPHRLLSCRKLRMFLMLNLSTRQKQTFIDDGYLVLPQAIPGAMIKVARQTINHNLGSVGMDPAKLTHYRSLSYCNEVQKSDAITDLFELSGVKQYAQALMGKGNVGPVSHVQIALRFPQPPYPQQDAPAFGGHLDGLGNGDNGSGAGDYARGFTMLAVIYLQDVLEPYNGNFTVWPGSHETVAAHVRNEGLDVLAKGQPKCKWPRPGVQINGKAGDIVLMHHNAIHTAAPNLGPDVRYAAIARICHVNMSKLGVQGIAEPWPEFEGLKELLDIAKAKELGVAQSQGQSQQPQGQSQYA